MSWNCLFIVACNTDQDALSAIGVEPAGPAISGDEASTSSFDGVALLQHGLDAVLINSNQSLLTAGTVLSQLLGREVVTALFGGVSDSYLWRVDAPGFERTKMSHAGETLDETGLAGPEEMGVRALDEDTLFAMLAVRTRFGAGDAWLSQPAVPVTWPPRVPEVAKKRWFGKA